MSLSPDAILAIATQIHEDTEVPWAEKTRVFGEKFAGFAKAYPTLFAMCCDPRADMSHLKVLLRHATGVRNQSTLHNASVNVGQHLVNTFIKPHLENAARIPENAARIQEETDDGSE